MVQIQTQVFLTAEVVNILSYVISVANVINSNICYLLSVHKYMPSFSKPQVDKCREHVFSYPSWKIITSQLSTYNFFS